MVVTKDILLHTGNYKIWRFLQLKISWILFLPWIISVLKVLKSENKQ